MNRIEYINIYISSKCNGKCTYCYLPDKKKIAPYNKEIREWLSTNKYITDIEEVYENKIRAIGFWGAEPLFNLDCIDIDKLLLSFSELDEIIISSGFISKINLLEDFIKRLNDYTINYKRKMLLSIQVSFDGNEEMNDIFRGKGTTKKVLANLDRIIDFLNSLKFLNLKIRISSGSTISNEMLDYLVEDFPDHQNFFHTLSDKLIKNINEDKKDNILINFLLHNKLATGTINYSKEDGIKYSKIQSREWEKRTKKSFKGFVQERFNILQTFKQRTECAAGITSFCIAPDKSVHLCHRTFDYIIPEILKNNSSMNNFVFYDKEKLLHYAYLLTSNLNFRININQAIIKELIECGEISEIYRNPFYSYILARHIATKFYCYMDNIYETGSYNVQSINLFKVYGNGALEYHIKNVMENL